MDNTENYDSYKIYIIMMSILSVLAFGWFFYNKYTYSSYETSFKKGLRYYKDIKNLESEIPVTNIDEQDNDEVAKIEKTITFFKRTVPGIQPKNVEVNTEKDNKNDVAFEETQYKLEFDSITRENLAKYIFYIKKQALDLKVKLQTKSLDMRKVENRKSYEDLWKVTNLEFIHRIVIE